MSRARRIVFLLHDFAAGGTERVAVLLANRWAGAGRQVTILCGSEEGPMRALVDPPVDVRPLSPAIQRGRASRLRLGIAARPAISRLEPDVVYLPGNFHLPLALLIARSKRPVIAAPISNPLIRADRGRLRAASFAWLFRRYASVASLLVATSYRLAEQARTLAPRAHVAVIPLPVIEDDAPPPSAPAPPSSELRLLAIGRLVPQKDFGLALKALAALRRTREARLTILGDGVEEAELKAQARTLGLDGMVSFEGFARDVQPALAAADLLLVTSRYEAGPAVAIEALAAGRRVVATDCSPALPDMLADARLGRITAADPDALAAAVIALAAEPPPPPALFAQAVAGYGIAAVADAWLDLLDETVARRAG